MSRHWELLPGALSGDDARIATEIREIFNGKRSIAVSKAFVAAWEERAHRADYVQDTVRVFHRIVQRDFVGSMDGLNRDLDQVLKSVTIMRDSINKLFLVFRGARVDGALSGHPLGRAKVVYEMYLDADAKSVYELKLIDSAIQPFFREELYGLYREIGGNYLYRYYLQDLLLETPTMTTGDFLTHVAQIQEMCREALSWRKLMELQGYAFREQILSPIGECFRDDPGTLPRFFSPRSYSDILEGNLKDYANDLPNNSKGFLELICDRLLSHKHYIQPLKPGFEYLVQHPEFLEDCPYFPPALLKDNVIVNTVAFGKDIDYMSLGQISEAKGWNFPAFAPRTGQEFYYAVFVSAIAILFENVEDESHLAPVALKELVARPDLLGELRMFLQTSFLQGRETDALHAALIVTEMFVAMRRSNSSTSWTRYVNSGVTYLKENDALAYEFERYMETFCNSAAIVMTYIQHIPETAVPEYELVKRVLHESYQFKVSRKCGVELVKPEGDSVWCSAVKLKIATSKLNIACPSSADIDEGREAKKFVNCYQACEMQLSELSKLATCFDPTSDTINRYGWREFDDVRVHTEAFRQRRDTLMTTIADRYVGPLTQFVPSQLHHLFHLFTREQTEEDGWTIILESLGLERPEEFRRRYHERLAAAADLGTFVANLAAIVSDEDAPRLAIPLGGNAISLRGLTGDGRIPMVKDSIDRV
jgi:hypothetical protein